MANPCDCFIQCPAPGISYASASATLLFRADLYFMGTAVSGGVLQSSISVTVIPGESGSAALADFNTAINTEATRLGLPIPTTIYGVQLAKLK